MDRREALSLLGLEEGAKPAEVTRAWHRLMRTVHPDLHGGSPEAARLARLANDAREALSKPAHEVPVPEPFTDDAHQTGEDGYPAWADDAGADSWTDQVAGPKDDDGEYATRGARRGTDDDGAEGPAEPRRRSSAVARIMMVAGMLLTAWAVFGAFGVGEAGELDLPLLGYQPVAKVGGSGST